MTFSCCVHCNEIFSSFFLIFFEPSNWSNRRSGGARALSMKLCFSRSVIVAAASFWGYSSRWDRLRLGGSPFSRNERAFAGFDEGSRSEETVAG